jgi:hypothetical protein
MQDPMRRHLQRPQASCACQTWVHNHAECAQQGTLKRCAFMEGCRILVLVLECWLSRRFCWCALLLLCATDLTWRENEAFEDMYERAGFMTTDDGALVMLAGSTLGGGEASGGSAEPAGHDSCRMSMGGCWLAAV